MISTTNSTPTCTECPKCGGAVVYKGYGATMVAYFSPPGHNHNDNCKIHMSKCVNGHEIRERQQNKCPAVGCDWVGKTKCFCSPLGIWIAEEGPPSYR